MKKPIAILEQFVEKANTITYMTSFLGYTDVPFRPEHIDWPYHPKSYAIFKIYDKKEMTFLQRLFDFGRYKKMLSKRMISSQINRRISA